MREWCGVGARRRGGVVERGGRRLSEGCVNGRWTTKMENLRGLLEEGGAGYGVEVDYQRAPRNGRETENGISTNSQPKIPRSKSSDYCNDTEKCTRHTEDDSEDGF